MNLAYLRSQNYYQLLGIKPTASGADIERAYERLSMIYDPNSEFRKNVLKAPLTELEREGFKIMTEAYLTLINLDKRLLYDRTLVHDSGLVGEIVGTEDEQQELRAGATQEVELTRRLFVREEVTLIKEQKVRLRQQRDVNGASSRNSRKPQAANVIVRTAGPDRQRGRAQAAFPLSGAPKKKPARAYFPQRRRVLIPERWRPSADNLLFAPDKGVFEWTMLAIGILMPIASLIFALIHVLFLR